jgi:hypothetical protein
LARLRGRVRVIAVNEAWRLAPFADVLYGCDGAYWSHHEGVPGFAGLKVTQDQQAAVKFPELNAVTVKAKQDQVLMRQAGVIGDGGNSGFQAVNLAAQFGIAEIWLVGFDMRLDKGVHFHGRHPRGLNNPSQHNLLRWRAAFMRAASTLAQLGITVINANRESHLTAFRFGDLGDLCLHH